MIRSVVPAVLALGVFPAVFAEDTLPKPTIGFEFGAGAMLYNDNRLEGNSVSFAILYAVGERINIGVYRESGYFRGEEDGDEANVDVGIQELRVGIDIWRNERGTQNVGVMMGFGYANYRSDAPDFDENDFIADLVARYTPIRAKTGPVYGELTLSAAYRYAPASLDLGLNEDADDIGGFHFSVGAGLYF